MWSSGPGMTGEWCISVGIVFSSGLPVEAGSWSPADDHEPGRSGGGSLAWEIAGVHPGAITQVAARRPPPAERTARRDPDAGTASAPAAQAGGPLGSASGASGGTVRG